jgi:hypothetical protein
MIETNQGNVTYGMATLVPPQQAAGLIRRAELGARWAKVGFPTFQSAFDEDVYVIGDSVGSNLPKSGHLAFESGIRVARHIADRVRDGQAEAALDLPSAICFAAFNAREAMEVNVTTQWDDFLGEMKRQPLVDKERSANALTTAEVWSTSVWAQLLG